ncbi:MAG: PAS domain-containing protein [SAR324 cluster bacterium]|nr:PAS domain-containing protein [SAR324 cluster bacterium]
MRFHSSLKHILTYSFIAIAVLPLMLTGIIAVQSLESSMKQEISSKNYLLAQSIAEELGAFLDYHLLLLHQVAEIVEKKKLIQPAQINQYLDSFVQNDGFFNMIQILDKRGIVLHLAPLNLDFLGMDMSGQSFFQTSNIHGGPYWSETFISLDTGNPTLTLSIPIERGMLVGFLNLDVLGYITEKIKIGLNGYGMVVDQNGIVIGHPDSELVAQRTNLRHMEMIEKGLAAQEGTYEYRLEGVLNISSVGTVAHSGWLVVITQTAKDAFAPIRHISTTILVGISTALVLALLISLFSLKKTLTPLMRLTEDTKRVAEGDYRLSTEEKSYQEVNDLTNNFQLMIEAVKHREDELKHLRNLLSNIVNSMPSILIGVDADSRVTHWNQEAEITTGIQEADAKGQKIQQVFPQLRGLQDNIHVAIQQGKPVKTKRVMNDQNETTQYSDVMIYPLVGSEVRGVVLRIDDVTDRVYLEEMMVQTEKMMSVGGLAAGMAHEINNPLSVILQSVQNIKRFLTLNHQQNRVVAQTLGIELEHVWAYMKERRTFDILEGMQESAERAAKIVRDMLKFSRPSEFQKEFVDIEELIESTINLASTDYDLKKQYDFRTIQIIREFDPNLPKVFCVAIEIQQVLLNLLRNAAQALHSIFETEDENDSKIILRTLKQGSMIQIEVEDNGTGMNEIQRKRVFEPFYTTKKVGIGTGLGLSVSYFIITSNHGGKIMVETAEGEGSKFVIQLPWNKNIDSR